MAAFVLIFVALVLIRPRPKSGPRRIRALESEDARMIPDLGKYAFAVLSSYACRSLRLVGLAWMSVQRAPQAATAAGRGRSPDENAMV